jgi:O-antigen ligase
MRRLLVFFLLGYLFFQSWTNAFSLHVLAPLHVIFGVISVVFFIIYTIARNYKIRIGVLRTEDILAAIVPVFIVVTALIHPRGASLNYVAAYTYVFGVGYMGVKVAMYNVISIRHILNWVLIGALVTALGSITEFVIEYGVGFDLGPYLFRHKQADALFGGLFLRSMAFSTEPAILAFFLETLGLIAVGTMMRREWPLPYKIVGIGVIVFGWVLTFSAASVAALGIGGLVALSIKWVRAHSLHRRLLPFLIVPLAIIGGILVLDFARHTLLGDIIVKITLQTDGSGSANLRMQRWMEGLRKISERPLVGEGPGTAAARGEISNLSWYIFLAVEAGIFSAITVLVFIASKTFRIVNSSVPTKYWFLAGSIAGSVHLAVISTFFHPFIWCLFSIFDILDTKCKR